MKAIILAAGYATRLYPLTKDKPKPLLEVKGQTILGHILDELHLLKELDEVFIVTNDRFFKNFLEWKDNYRGTLKVTIVNDRTKSNEDRLGSLGDIKYVIETMNVQEDVIIVAGDNLFEFSLREMMRLYNEKKKPVVALYDVLDLELAKQYGIVSVDGSKKIIHFEEKPANPKSTLSSTGIYVYPMKTIGKLMEFVEKHGKKDKAGDFLEWLHKEEEVYCHLTKDKWFDIGTMDQLEKACREFNIPGHRIKHKKKKTILVTGGAGFLGSFLCDALIAENRVICVDNFFTGSEENIKHLLANPNFRLIKHDIITPLFIDDEKIDQLYNLACPASPVHYQYNAIRTVKANILGTMNMLGLAKKHNARILQASTSEVYGDPLMHPQKESYRGNVNPIGIRACYDEGKRCAETLMFDYHRQNNVDIRVVRIFNTYGPRMAANDGRVVSNFIIQAIKGDDITIYGSGKQTRSFCYVSDLIDGMVRMMGQEEFAGPVNLGNPDEFTILELAENVIKITKSKSRVVFKPLPNDDPERRKPDIILAKEKLGWEPKVNLNEGLKDTIQYFKELL